MKKRITYGLLAALMVCGCQEEELNLNVSEPKTFKAIIEDNYSGGTTKTSLDENGNVLWKKGDQVSVFAGSTINEQYQITDESDGKTSANLNRVSTPDFVAGSEIGNNVAYYPYSSTNAISKGENGYKISVVLPLTQTYAEASFANGAFPMAAITSSSDDMNLKFKNVLGGLKLQLKGTVSIASISISGNNDEILCGAANVSVSTTGVPSIALTDASAKTITLDCGAGVQLNTETATAFIIALPQMTMASGFTVIVKDTEGKQMEIKTEKSQTIKRSSILKMPVVNYNGKESDSANGHKYVDLGLSVMWATCNVGASKPEETGNYYAWGEIKGYDEEDPDNTRFSGKKTYYWWDTYKYGDFTSISKYCIDSYYGSIDGKVVLEKEDDAAYVNLGENWRMPTTEEFAELNKNCTITWIESNNTEFNGVPGLKIQSKKTGFTDKYIFLPASGYYQQSHGRYDFHSCGYYWTSSISSKYSSQAYAYYAARSNGCYINDYARPLGQSIRPVYCEDSNAGVSGVSLNKTSATVRLGDKLELYPTVEKNSGAVNTAVSWMSSNPSVAKLTLNNPYTYAEITALSSGTTVISAKTAFGSYVATCTVTVPVPSVVNAPYVDLGLPSGTLWAAYNVGASDPEEYGNYYAWGETTSKASFSWSTYKHCKGSSSSITKYNGSSTLELIDDAAYLNWGSDWRMATYAEWKELQDYCTWEWTNRNGVSGHLITSKNNGNSIFLPAAGYADGGIKKVGTSGGYWTSSCSSAIDAYFMTFDSGSTTCETDRKYSGYSVRAVHRDN